MPCIVPNCDSKGQSFTLRFPRSHFLYERWREAIELGSGSTLPADIDPLQAEICQQHFDEVDRYSEPINFRNRSLDRDVHLSSCRLCLRFDFAERVAPVCGGHLIGDIPIEEVLKSIFKIQLDNNYGVCEACLVRLDIVVTIRKQFAESAKCWQKMDVFINEENRLRYRKALKAETIRVPNKVMSATREEMQQESRPISQVVQAMPVKLETKTDYTMKPSKLVNTPLHDEASLEDIERNDGNNHPVSSRDDNFVREVNQSSTIEETKVTMRHKTTSKENSIEKRGIGRPRKKSAKVSKEKVHLKGMTERKCYMCVQLFQTSEELFAHMVVHVDHDLTCNVCNQPFPNLTKYNRHLAKHDSVERPMKCDHCELRFADGLGKRRHEKQRHNIDHSVTVFNSVNSKRKGKYTCQHCGKQCLSLSFLKEHEDAHAGIKRHECRSCGRLFANKNNLERHHLIHTSEKPYKCQVCGKAFRQSPMYKDHLRLHSGETPYACNGCDMQFTSTTLLRKHKIRFHGAISTPTNNSLCTIRPHNHCRFCMSSFKRHSLLIDHIERHHPYEEIEYLRCPTCEQQFVVKQAFELHLRNHEKNFQCEFCDKAFSTLQALKFHQPIHDGIRGYSCKTCSKSFTHVANLKRHELLHLGIKRHECDFCGKRFAQSNQLHTHRRTHTGEKPYECQKCGKRFADNSTLCKHKKSVCKPM
ncbi:zinc finger protein ZFP2-like [Topomyia yanbarensis]|uniref:zinc finger protein ZFP2-like n=1 Tax=Topomyia yanbarensis TaxID=2498891 RepID=UPI00273B575F|nr:zinc finger protein ZFP2-like [Topomyia yanbarensis]